MVALADRLVIPNGLRYGWLQANDTYLLCELNNIFGKKLFIRGAVESKQNGSDKANDYFDKFPEVDYFIYSTSAPTHCNLVYTEKSRILFYRPGKTWSRGKDGKSHTRLAACRFVRLKQQILTIFDEELYTEP